jgi:pimeloyl-ACP methyl ester carboxylesterase
MVDLRNHGDSFHDDSNTLNDHSNDIMKVLEAENIDKVHLIGHSFGG